MSLPAATNGTLGTEKFGVGPTAVVLTQPGDWSFGLLVNQIWSTSGAKDREDVNRTYLQPFMDYNLGSGLSVGASAEVAGNREADDGTWSGPLLFRVSKVTMLGKRPVKLQADDRPGLGAGLAVSVPGKLPVPAIGTRRQSDEQSLVRLLLVSSPGLRCRSASFPCLDHNLIGGGASPLAACSAW
jgi:hypothetical protein